MHGKSVISPVLYQRLDKAMNFCCNETSCNVRFEIVANAPIWAKNARVKKQVNIRKQKKHIAKIRIEHKKPKFEIKFNLMQLNRSL